MTWFWRTILIFAAAALVVFVIYTYVYVSRSVREATERADRYAAQVDSLRRVYDAKLDSIRYIRMQRDSLLALSKVYRDELQRIEKEVDIRPSFDYEGTDSALAARVDSVLRERIRASGD